MRTIRARWPRSTVRRLRPTEIGGLLLALCACGPTASGTQPANPAPPAPAGSEAPVGSSVPVTASSLPPAPVPPAPSVPEAALRQWTKVLDHPAASIGVGDKRIAVLTREGKRDGTVWVREANGKWVDTLLGDDLKAPEGSRDDLRLWFGRDDRPRLMGTRSGPQGESMVYLRHKGVWRTGFGEIGRLGNAPQAALFGILGHADPEVVCKLGDICIIKRITGWTMIPVPSERMHVELVGKGAIAAGRTSALRLGKDAWQPIGAGVPWKGDPGGIWGSEDGEIWVSIPEADRLYHLDGNWTEHPSPIAGPNQLWGKPGDVWLSGAGGLAHHDGTRWRRDSTLRGPCRDVRGHDGAVYAACDSGVWRGTP